MGSSGAHTQGTFTPLVHAHAGRTPPPSTRRSSALLVMAIDIFRFPHGLAADFTETIFKGPLHTMLSQALSHLHAHVILEKVIKHSDRAVADRFFNYAYSALEEALCNAVFHRAYDIREPIEIRILPDCITIASFSSLDRSILTKDIEAYRLIARRYRNRRIGEFLKELEMTEGRGTGMHKILWEINKNQSPKPILHTDEERTYFVVEFPIQPIFKVVEDLKQEVNQPSTEEVPGKYRGSTGEVLDAKISNEIVQLLKNIIAEMTRKELQARLNLTEVAEFSFQNL